MDKYLENYLEPVASCSVFPDNKNSEHLIYTRWENFTVPFDGPEEIRKLFKENSSQRFNYGSGNLQNFGFLRAICTKSGEILAYTRAKRLFPDPFPSRFRRGEWYDFEEYNPKLMESFEYSIHEPESNDTAIWTYDTNMRCYKLEIVGDNKTHYFLVRKTYVVSDFGEDTRTYKHIKQHNKIDENIEHIIKDDLMFLMNNPKNTNHNSGNMLQKIVQKLKNRIYQ